MNKKVLIVFGTRPEAIKMAPLVYEFKKHKDKFETKVCVTAQHRQMLDQVLDFFNIIPDYDLNLMKDNQTLSDITVNVLKGMDGVISDFKPDLIFVQGDTTTTFVTALAGFYNKTRVAHLEAGLRSFNKYSPFPEEINRILAGHLSDFHFTPTMNAYNNLINEGIKNNVYNVGNTVIDALFLGIEIINKQGNEKFINFFKNIDFNKRIILVTGHRRESFGEPFQNICLALKNIAEKNNDVEIIYPVHLNPNVQKPVYSVLKGINNVHLIEPLDYPYLIWLMDKSYLVLTDSGGIQEEAPSLGKPVLVMREVTERIEGIEAGTAKLVGTDPNKIISETQILLEDKNEYLRMSKAVNPYGDGKTSERIIKILLDIF
jgi:UDP-N-acetylglucosamine 2-epimerase (non-hydrolysing)